MKRCGEGHVHTANNTYTLLLILYYSTNIHYSSILLIHNFILPEMHRQELLSEHVTSCVCTSSTSPHMMTLAVTHSDTCTQLHTNTYTCTHCTHPPTPTCTHTQHTHTHTPGTVGLTSPLSGWWVGRHSRPPSAAGSHGENPAICSN